MSIASLIGTGVTLGVVHVLTGPDHLSALATLSAADPARGFWLGIRWGIGHSTGLLLVAVVLMVIGGDMEISDECTHFFESVVGVFMILLGVYGMKRAFERRYKGYGSVVEMMEETTDVVDDPEDASHENAATEEIIEEEAPRFPCINTRTLACLAGIVHGLAGPGGVLGVIPAVQLKVARLAALYLLCFCVTSTITMGTFAYLYGACSMRVPDFLIESLSAALSLLVGILWLVLLSLGKLEDIFP